MLLYVITITIYYPFTSRDAPLSMQTTNTQELVSSIWQLGMKNMRQKPPGGLDRDLARWAIGISWREIWSRWGCMQLVLFDDET